VVVIAPHHHIVFQNEFCLEFVERVFGQILGVVAVVPVRVLVGDHHVQACRMGALEHVERRHHGGRDALHGGVGIPNLEGVPRGALVPRYSLVLPD
jgi:hypothetical protein